MRIRGLGRLKAQWTRLRGQLTPGPMVLFYHRVAILERDPQLLAVTPEHFEEHLLILKADYQVMPLRQMVAELAMGRPPRRSVVITFDDGFEDNVTEALPLLKKHDIPATFYLTTGFIGRDREFLQDELERLILLPSMLPPKLELQVGSQMRCWILDPLSQATVADPRWNVTMAEDPTCRHMIYRQVHNLLRSCSVADRKEALTSLRNQCGDAGQARPTHRVMTWQQVRLMATCRLVELGAHTVNHLWLGTRTVVEQRVEVTDSKIAIEKEVGQEVVSFAYPYGWSCALNSDTVRLVKEAGFQNACTTSRCRISRDTDPYQIPRLCVRDWDGERFRRELRSGQL